MADFEGDVGKLESLQRKLDRLEDELDWADKGLAEWRATALSNARQAKAARATARIAIGHLQSVLNTARTFDEQQAADIAARDWLVSIGNDVEETK